MSRERVILPGSTIGILGGGQLGMMLALQARAMGYRIASLDPDPSCPCSGVSDTFLPYAYDSLEGARALAEISDVITYEFENISAELAKVLETESYLPQGYKLLYQTKNRIREKSALISAGVPVADYRVVSDRDTLFASVEALGLPAILKIADGGYDGKGQWVMQSSADVQTAADALQAGRDYVLEKFVPFVKELSVIVAQNRQGQVKTFPVGENIHRNNVLHMTIAPARVDAVTAESARKIAHAVAEHLGLTGLLAIELFLLPDGSLLVNELAPRPHNSGHYTQDACLCSQFEQHIRAICNLPLGDTQIDRPAVMVNILGEHLDRLLALYPALPPSWKVHLYGKTEVRSGRKLGHINIVGTDYDAAMQSIRSSRIWEE